jgi:PAS domain S-box-containing protein
MADDSTKVMMSLGALRASAWFFENSLDIFLSLQGHEIRKVNATWRRQTGWSVKEAADRPIWDFVHPEEAATTREAIERLSHLERTDVEFRLRAKSGAWLWMRAHLVRGDEDWVLAILRDITAERQREDDSREARHAAGMLATTAGVTIWRYNPGTDKYTIDPDFTRSERARVAERKAGGDLVRSTVHRADAPALQQAWEHTLSTGEAGKMSYRELTPDRSWRHMRVAWRGMRQLASGRWEILGIAQDVTELVASRDAALAGEREARAAAAAKSQFLSNVSHEIRTPMNGVLGVLQLIKQGPAGAERDELIDEALSCGVGLSDLLNDIIDFSDVEADRIELACEPIDPVSELDHVIALVKPRTAEKDLRLVVSSDPGTGLVSADPRRLRKMFFHLISNAVKFTSEGSVVVRLSASGDGEGRRLRFEVEDTGIGVPPEARAGLFRHFSQADTSNTRRFGGLGLGLATTRRLAELMGGNVGFTPRPDGGSLFWFDVATPASLPVPADKAAPVWLAGLRMLVVEDNPTNRLVATHILATLGAEVHIAENGAEAVEAVRCCAYDIVFMDIQMPVMDGVEATRRIRALPEPACLVPIVATTASVMPQQLIDYRRCGMNGVLPKPISPAALIAEIARVANDVRPHRLGMAASA